MIADQPLTEGQGPGTVKGMDRYPLTSAMHAGIHRFRTQAMTPEWDNLRLAMHPDDYHDLVTDRGCHHDLQVDPQCVVRYRGVIIERDEQCRPGHPVLRYHWECALT